MTYVVSLVYHFLSYYWCWTWRENIFFLALIEHNPLNLPPHSIWPVSLWDTCLSYCLVGKVSGWGSWDCCLRLEVKRKWRFKDFKDFDLLTHRPLVDFPAIMALCSGERAVILVTCLGAYFLSMAMIYQMSPFFEVYARNNCGASTVTVGLIFAAMPATSFLGNLVMDVMIRKFGVEVMMDCGLILLAMSSLGFGLSSSVTSWVIWRAMQGLATAPIYTSISTRLARTFTGDGEFHRVVGLQEVCGNVGVTCWAGCSLNLEALHCPSSPVLLCTWSLSAFLWPHCFARRNLTSLILVFRMAQMAWNQGRLMDHKTLTQWHFAQLLVFAYFFWLAFPCYAWVFGEVSNLFSVNILWKFWGQLTIQWLASWCLCLRCQALLPQ